MPLPTFLQKDSSGSSFLRWASHSPLSEHAKSTSSGQGVNVHRKYHGMEIKHQVNDTFTPTKKNTLCLKNMNETFMCTNIGISF